MGGDPDREGLRTGLFMVRGGVKARGHAREDCPLAPLPRHSDEGHGALTPPRPAEGVLRYARHGYRFRFRFTSSALCSHA